MKIAPRLGIEPITWYELEECLLADVPKEADIIISLARAKAELEFGSRLAGYPLVPRPFAATSPRPAMGSVRLLPTTEHPFSTTLIVADIVVTFVTEIGSLSLTLVATNR